MATLIVVPEIQLNEKIFLNISDLKFQSDLVPREPQRIAHE
jgi:hypothetical protein